MLNHRIARPLAPELARMLGIEDQAQENQVDEKGEGTLEKVVIINEGYQIAEAPIEEFVFLPSVGEGWRQGGVVFKVTAIIYNLEDGIIEIHVKQGG